MASGSYSLAAEDRLAFFEDLTPYTYLRPEEERAGTVNVGWLAKAHQFPTGETSEEFRTRLGALCKCRRVKRTRGLHGCEFCTGPDRPHGSAEIRVVGRKQVYAAPELIGHYVSAHNYKPPVEFIEAVLKAGQG
jgi:hypothetical protein